MVSRFSPRRWAPALTALALAASPAFTGASPAFTAPRTPSVPGSSSAAPAPTQARVFADRIAARYGLADFPKVRSFRFTFNVRRDGKDTAREWTWFPTEDSVLFKGKDPKGLMVRAEYSRKNPYSMGSETVAGIDKNFIHDQYWLLFPLHLAWDEGLDLKLGEGGTLLVRYPKQDGHALGDAYDLDADSAGAIRSWIIHRGGADSGARGTDNGAKEADSAALSADWSKPVDVDGLPISLERQGRKGFKVWFSKVKVVGIKR